MICLLVIPAGKIMSIPAFARKYQISCQVCHAPAMPKLKPFGDEFAKNGFRMTEYESPRYYIPVGDDRLSLFRELPLSIRIDGFVTYNFNDENAVSFSAPYIIKILSGGELSEHLSYYFYFLMNERGSVAGVEDAFLVYNDLFRTGIDIYLGQFQASDPLFKNELRYTLEPYMIYDAAPGASRSGLKYDRGLMVEKRFSFGTDILIEILNGNGIGEGGEGMFDSDKYKNVMLRLNQAIGKSLSVGIFGYTGKELLPSLFTSYINRVRMIGPDLSLNIDDKLIVNLQYVYRTDSRVVTGTGIINDAITRGGFAEVTYSPNGDMSKWYLTGLFNYVASEDDDLDYTAATLHAGYLLRRNVRLVTEFTWQFENDNYGRINAGFVSAF
jgi:hypothetical protein